MSAISLPSELILGSATVMVSAVAVVLCRAFRRSDFVIITGFGRHYVIDNPFPFREDKNEIILAGPFIRPINEFLFAFANSSENAIELTAQTIASDSDVSPLLRSLQTIPFENLRLRLRVMSSLNPIVNLESEEGTIRFSSRRPDNTECQFEIRSIFAPKGKSILLEAKGFTSRVLNQTEL